MGSHRQSGLRALGAALVLAGVGAFSVAAHAGQAGGDDGLALFGEMMPVFTSPRCSNCHGGTNPVTGANHEPGPVTDGARDASGNMTFDEKQNCQECHTAGTGMWMLAPQDKWFVGKDTLTLCRQIRRSMDMANPNPDNRRDLVFHITTDDLVGVGFVGQGGIGDDSPFAPITPAPPPMSKADMVAAAQQWVGPGQGKCGPNSWNGTITATTVAKNHEDRQPGTLLQKDSATELKITMTVVDSTAKSEVSFTQHDFTDQQIGRPCWIIHDSWQAEGRGDARLNIIGDPAEGPSVFLAWTIPEYSGTHQSDKATVPPACKHTVRDEPYSVRQSSGGVQPKVDPNDPNHLVGESVVEDPNNKMTTTIKWNLSREP